MSANQYNPNYACPLGWVLEEHMEVHKLSPAELAIKCECQTSRIDGIINNEDIAGPELAAKFEKIFGLERSIWLEIETNRHKYVKSLMMVLR